MYKISSIYWAYRNKVTNKLFGVVKMRHKGKRSGNALVSFITGPFTKAPWEFFTDPHSNYWTSKEIVRLLNVRGYDVDIINWDNKTFIPKKKYAICIDIQHNLERLSPRLGSSCVKVMFVLSSYPLFQNNAEQTRIDNLEKRRGVKFSHKRHDVLSNNIKYIDFISGYGNETVYKTYPLKDKKIVPIPAPAVKTYKFPKDKNFEKVQTHFLFFGGGGAILKGLDLVVEAFSTMPNLHLHIVGPAAYEKEFAKEYEKEFALPNIHRYQRPKISKNGIMTVGEKLFSEIADQCASMIYPSASEGTSGAVIQAMYAGVIPVVTKATGLPEDSPSIIIENPSVESII
ncbi:MAG: hypothetical protein COU27_02240, partial [Candidatus Levybacteria bacterium CG10_big_fil_rev_8_21_14_0_10_36_7]